jgi:hypothetical protein
MEHVLPLMGDLAKQLQQQHSMKYQGTEPVNSVGVVAGEANSLLRLPAKQQLWNAFCRSWMSQQQQLQQ